MDAARIATLLEPFLESPLPKSALAQISTYIDLLLKWNARINLTAIRDPEEIVTRHFGESLFLARHLFSMERQAPVLSAEGPSPVRPFAQGDQVALISADPFTALDNHTAIENDVGPSKNDVGASKNDFGGRAALQGRVSEPVSGGALAPADEKARNIRVFDIGSGAGFPAIPLKLWAPSIQLVLIESNHKKAAFLREVARALTLMDINVMPGRAEAVADRLGPSFPPADFVTLRAVEKFETILPVAQQFLASGSRLALLVGSSQADNLPTLLPTLRWAQPIPVPLSHSRVVAIATRASS